MGTKSTYPAVDWGRVVAVPFFCLALVGNASRLPDLWSQGPLVVGPALAVLVFYTVLTLQYLRRGPASDSDRRLVVWLVSLAGMLAPFGIVPASPGGATPLAARVGAALILLGLLGAVWSLLHLGRNISVIPQVRDLSATGPYSLLRHPLYVFELVAAAGLVMINGGGLGWAVLGFAAICLSMRSIWEEQLLARELPAYREYLARRSRA